MASRKRDSEGSGPGAALQLAREGVEVYLRGADERRDDKDAGNAAEEFYLRLELQLARFERSEIRESGDGDARHRRRDRGERSPGLKTKYCSRPSDALALVISRCRP